MVSRDRLNRLLDGPLHLVNDIGWQEDIAQWP